MPELNRSQVIDLLQAKRNLRSARALAIEMKVSHGYLCDVLAGKRDPGPSILAYLSLEKRTVTVYHRRRVRAAR